VDLSGMDTQTAKALADELDAKARAISGVIATVDGIVSGLMDVWEGQDMEAFAGSWRQVHRPAAANTAGQLGAYVTKLRQEVSQQEEASDGQLGGGSVAFGPVGSVGVSGQSNVEKQLMAILTAGGLGAGGMSLASLFATLPPSLQRVWDDTDPLRSIETISEDLADGRLVSKYGADWEEYESAIMSPDFKKLAGSLGAVSTLFDVSSVAQGIRDHDGTETTFGVISLAADAGDRIPGADIVSIPLTGALAAYSLLGLPTSDAQATSVSDQAVIDHFPGANINKLTPHESEWLDNRYTGIAAPFHAVEDGVRYQLDKLLN
jgi:uncharacterized protein YukE